MFMLQPVEVELAATVGNPSSLLRGSPYIMGRNSHWISGLQTWIPTESFMKLLYAL